jgi:hypothetical protein
MISSFGPATTVGCFITNEFDSPLAEATAGLAVGAAVVVVLAAGAGAALFPSVRDVI